MVEQALPRPRAPVEVKLQLPTFFPVTTFGNKYPLDRLIRPYLPRSMSGHAGLAPLRGSP